MNKIKKFLLALLLSLGLVLGIGTHHVLADDKAFTSVTVTANSWYSHTENGHVEGDEFNLPVTQPSVTLVGTDTVVKGEIVRDKIGEEGGTIKITYELKFDRQGTYLEGSISCTGGYVTIQRVGLVVGQKYQGTFDFLLTSDGHSGSGSYLYPIVAEITLTPNDKGNIKFLKQDSPFSSVLSGVVFHIKYNDENGQEKNYDLTTGADGYTPVSVDIPKGTTVTWWETSAPEPYVVNSTQRTVVIKAGETVSVTAKNHINTSFNTGSFMSWLKIIASVMIVGVLLFVQRKRIFAMKF